MSFCKKAVRNGLPFEGLKGIDRKGTNEKEAGNSNRGSKPSYTFFGYFSKEREREKKKLADLVSSFLFFEPYLEGKKRSRRRRLPGTAEADIRVYGPEKKCRKEWTGVVLRCSVGYLATFWPDLRQSKVMFYGEHCQSTALGCLLLIVHIVGLHFVNHIEYFKGRAYNV